MHPGSSLPIAPQGMAPPPKQPPAKSRMPSQAASPKAASVPKRTTERRNDVRLQTARERQQRSEPNREVVIFASEATRLSLETAQSSSRATSEQLTSHFAAHELLPSSSPATSQQLTSYFAAACELLQAAHELIPSISQP